MAQRYVPILQQEIALSVEPASASSILHITPNTQNGHLFSAGRKRPYDEISGVDEESFARKHLATEALVFFRRADRSPRSILWRVLNNRQLLEVQSVDLVQERRHARDESLLTFHIDLPVAIALGGVAFADSKQKDALEIFILTTSNELYNITLGRDLLLKDAVPKDFDSSKCVQHHHLSSLSFRRPFRFMAHSASELLISLQDGGLMLLEKKEPGTWHETYFSEGGWTGTLRGLLPLKRQRTVKFGDVELDTAAATAMVKTPAGELIWTVSLDHVLGAWSTRTGKMVARRDLMGERRDLDERSKSEQYIIPAESSSIMQMVLLGQDTEGTSHEDGGYFLIVYSPKTRVVKIYHGAELGLNIDETPVLREVTEGVNLRLPFDDILNTNLWRLNSFHVKAGQNWEETKLIVDVQSGSQTEVFSLTFDLLSDGELNSDLEAIWADGWTSIARDNINSRHDDIPLADSNTQSTPSDKWLQFLLQPGRYCTASLETALDMYRKRRKLTQSSSKALRSQQVPLEERLSQTVSAGLIQQKSNERSDPAKYYAELHAQWLGYHSIVADLQNRRSHSIATAYDDETELVWHVYADFIAPASMNDRADMLTANVNLDADAELYEKLDDGHKSAIITQDEDWEVMKLLAAAQDFASALPKTYQHSFAKIAITTALDGRGKHLKKSDASQFFDSADVGQHVADEIYQNLELDLQPLNGIGGLKNHAFDQALKAIEKDSNRGSSSTTSLNRYGSRFMVARAQHLIQRNKSIILDMLTLVAFINNDIEAQALDSEFDTHKLLDLLMSHLRQIELRDWLVRTPCVEPSRDEQIVSTVFESLFIGDWQGHAPADLSFSQKLTHWSEQWTFAAFDDWHGFTANIFATLLRRKEHDIASSFTPFLQQSKWTEYLLARLCLATDDIEQSSIHFAGSAKGLAKKGESAHALASLLAVDEQNMIGQGLEQYYLHVANLFEQSRAFSNVAEFAQLALDQIDESRVDNDLAAIDLRKSTSESPFDKVADARAEIQALKIRGMWDEIVSRLFGALVQTGRFAEAYTVLLKTKRPDLRRSNLQRLIDGCIKNEAHDILLELPFEGDAADTADAALLSMAKKSLASGTTFRPAQRVLYAFRTKRGDYRGASQVLYEYLERLRNDKRGARHDPEDETLLQSYLILINTLACCGAGEEWLLAEPIPGVHAVDQRRKLVTLEQIRREYVHELDRRSDLQHGRFPLVGNDDVLMDVF